MGKLHYYYVQFQDEVNVKLRNSVPPTSSKVSQFQVPVNIISGCHAVSLERTAVSIVYLRV